MSIDARAERQLRQVLELVEPDVHVQSVNRHASRKAIETPVHTEHAERDAEQCQLTQEPKGN